MPSAAAISASLSLRKGAASPVGPGRIALLEAIGAHGSISGAAKSVGLSYKGAWDAVQALNNLSPSPLVTTRAGGRQGGFAEVTAQGQAVIAAFHAVEAELAHVFAGLERRLAGGGEPVHTLLWSLGMKTSARNALRGVVEEVIDGAVNAEVTLSIGEGAKIVAVITRQSVEALDLAPGRPAIALIKASFVILAKGGGEPLRTSARNALPGTVVRVERGAVNDEVTLDIGGGKTLSATITHASVEALDLAVGERATALIKASHVILAVE
jgi:molybdate transport system regulatory protein